MYNDVRCTITNKVLYDVYVVPTLDFRLIWLLVGVSTIFEHRVLQSDSVVLVMPKDTAASNMIGRFHRGADIKAALTSSTSFLVRPLLPFLQFSTAFTVSIEVKFDCPRSQVGKDCKFSIVNSFEADYSC